MSLSMHPLPLVPDDTVRIARAAFRIEDTAATVRNLVFCLLLPLYCAVLLAAMGGDLLIPPGFLAELSRSLR